VCVCVYVCLCVCVCVCVCRFFKQMSLYNVTVRAASKEFAKFQCCRSNMVPTCSGTAFTSNTARCTTLLLLLDLQNTWRWCVPSVHSPLFYKKPPFWVSILSCLDQLTKNIYYTLHQLLYSCEASRNHIYASFKNSGIHQHSEMSD